MSLRQIVWTATFLVVAIPLAFLGLVAYDDARIQANTDAHEAEKREWIASLRAEAPRALGKLQQIRAELASGNVPDWAGEYSWTGRTMRGSCGMSDPWTHGEGIAVAPNAGAVWWMGRPGADTAWALDYGRIVTADDEHVVVEWTINPKHPHVYELYRVVYLLSDELVRVRWDDGDFLVPATRMPAFCSEWIGLGDELDSFAPRRGGWKVGPTASEPDWIDYGKRPPPLVPDRWRPYVLPVPITANARLEGPPESLRSWRVSHDDQPPSWWKRLMDRKALSRDNLVRWRYCMSAGTDQGLRVGMPVTFASDVYSVCGVITDTSAAVAHVEFIDVGIDDPYTQQPYEAVRFTTGVPWKR